MFTWVLIHKLIDQIGYSDDAVRAKKKNGVWREGIHWIKAPDNRILFNPEAIRKWMERKD